MSDEVLEVQEELTDEESEMFQTLLTVGCLTKVIDVFGYKILLKTLNVDEDLQVSLAVKPYTDSLGFSRAYKTYVVAAAIRSIDSKPLISSLTPFDEIEVNSVQAKYEKIKEYYPVVIDKIYDELTQLEQRMVLVMSRLGKQ